MSFHLFHRSFTAKLKSEKSCSEVIVCGLITAPIFSLLKTHKIEFLRTVAFSKDEQYVNALPNYM